MPACGLDVGIGADQEEAPVGELGQGGPGLLAVDQVVLLAVVAVIRSALGLQRGEVGAGARLGIALAPPDRGRRGCRAGSAPSAPRCRRCRAPAPAWRRRTAGWRWCRPAPAPPTRCISGSGSSRSRPIPLGQDGASSPSWPGCGARRDSPPWSGRPRSSACSRRAAGIVLGDESAGLVAEGDVFGGEIEIHGALLGRDPSRRACGRPAARRRLPIRGGASALGHVAACRRHASKSAMTRILTYNVHRCVGLDRRVDVGRVAEVIAAAGAGHRRPRRRWTSAAPAPAGSTRRIARRAPGHGLPLQRRPASRGRALRRRDPHRAARTADQGRPPARAIRASRSLEPRGALWVAIELAGGRELQVINTHLGLVPREQRFQAPALAGPDWLAAPARRDPLILLGDFNATSATRPSHPGRAASSTPTPRAAPGRRGWRPFLRPCRCCASTMSLSARASVVMR